MKLLIFYFVSSCACECNIAHDHRAANFRFSWLHVGTDTSQLFPNNIRDFWLFWRLSVQRQVFNNGK